MMFAPWPHARESEILMSRWRKCVVEVWLFVLGRVFPLRVRFAPSSGLTFTPTEREREPDDLNHKNTCSRTVDICSEQCKANHAK